ncbi:hypothetical protein Slin14017_G051870 [Septoria linicola]|nr:hypothetical protein Slin14017_G051870 [Septoria linicola]
MLNIATTNSPTDAAFTPNNITVPGVNMEGVNMEDSLIILITSTLCLSIALLLLLDIMESISKDFHIKAPGSDDCAKGLVVLTYIGLTIMAVCRIGFDEAGSCEALYSCWVHMLILGGVHGMIGLVEAVDAVKEYYREGVEGGGRTREVWRGCIDE